MNASGGEVVMLWIRKTFSITHANIDTVKGIVSMWTHGQNGI